ADNLEANAFTIAVDASAIPDAYGGFQTEVYYAGLVYTERSCLAEVIWRPDNPLAFNCNTVPSGDDAVRRLDARASDDGFLPLNPSYHVGRLVEMQVHCDEEHQSAVGLTKFQTSGAGVTEVSNDGSTFFKANEPGNSSLRLVTSALPAIGERSLDVDGNTVKETGQGVPQFLMLDVLRITCVSVEPPPPPTASPTVTATLDNPPTATNTPCPAECPTHTSTNTPVATDTPTRTETPTITETPTETPTPAPPDFAHDTVPPGGKVSTGPDARPDDPLETSVTLPVGGKVSIIEKLIVQPDPAGFHLIGQQVNISAPAGTAQFPLIIQFLLDESIIPEGVTAANIPLFKGGILVPNCADLSGKASPDPCVAKRVRLTGPAEGDIQLTVYTSTASAWNFGEPTTTGPKPDLGDVNGDGVIDPLDALWVVFQTAGIAEVPWPNVSDVNDDGVIDPLDASLILQFAAGLIDEFPGAPSGIFWSWLGF
ncbi:MAG: dockerin type I repeat-containing protein, partial [Chloroflexi bacterium]|nr:dockerin type I repeat-containing protein [Chloroflexota bacterium]